MDLGRHAVVVFDASGVVVAVTGGAPLAWYGRAFDALGPEGTALAALVPDLIRAARGQEGVASAAVAFEVGDEKLALDVVVLFTVAIARHRADAGALIERAVAPFRGQAEDRDVALSIDAGDTRVGVDVDEAKIVWVIATLIGNALRFSRAGTRRLPGGAVRVRLTTELQGAERFAMIDVEDDGPGIDEWRLQRLFRPSDGTRPTGIALQMARDVALAHGGGLELESSTTEPHGTRVRLKLPVAASSP